MLTSNKKQNRTGLHLFLILALIVLMGAATVFLSPTRRVSAQATASWSYTGNLNIVRRGQTATLLPNGKVLLVGGYQDVDAINDTRTVELYDPATEAWTRTGNLNFGRFDHTATLLPNGKVLVAGGVDCPKCSGNQGVAELYDPSTGTWSMTGSLNTGRSGHTATLLPDGKVLVAGGGFLTIITTASAELYDPASGTWTFTGALNTSRSGHTATLLNNGKVLVAGGFSNCSNFICSILNTTEQYDPSTATWSLSGNLNTARDSHSATLLPNGKVLVAGGFINFNTEQVTNSVELYDPSSGIWTNAGILNDARGLHTATLLLNGKVLVAGGLNGSELETAELYEPSTGTWMRTADLNEARDSHSAVLLASGKVLVAAGGVVFSGSNTAELYDPGTSSFNQIDDTQFFVSQHYRDFLNRQADPAGLNFWTGEIFKCGNDQGCIEAKRVNVSAAFYLSIEFQQSGYLVYRFYKSAFGNLPGAPVPVKLIDFLPDAQTLGQGVIVNQGNWQQQLETNKQNYAAAFVQRAAFASAYPTSMTPDAFVDKLFVNAGVTPSSSDRSAAVAEFGSASNTADVAARARALRRVADNGTLVQQEFNRAFVLMQYFGYLRRNPNDAPDGNFNGYNFWLDKLNQFNGDFIGAEMVRAFLISDEYRHRFGP